jgi:RES domain-containing protein
VNYDRRLLERLARLPAITLQRVAYRHMFANFQPDRENTVGARWNPREVPAIYTALSREGVLAEAEHQLSMEPLRPRVRRTLYTINVGLSSVLDLTGSALTDAGLSYEALVADDYSLCQQVGGAVEHLDHDGLLIPNVRLPGATNLVIFPNRQSATYQFEIADAEVLFDPTADNE